MPTYDYACPQCGKTASLLRPIDKRDQPILCQNHHTIVHMTRVPSAPAFSVQGFNAANGYAKRQSDVS